MQSQVSVLGVFFAVLSGLGFAMLGISYRLGMNLGLSMERIVAAVGFAGALFFGFQRETNLGDLPTRVWVLGLAAGLTQFLTVQLFKRALAWGPLSPVWCAVSLSFVPTTIYAWALCGETLSPVQMTGVAAGGACVICGALQQRQTLPGQSGGVRFLPYAGALLGVFALNAVVTVAIKHLSAVPPPPAESLLAAHRASFFAVMFLALGIPCVLYSLKREGLPTGSWRAALVVLLAVAGSLGGNRLLVAGVPLLPGATVFTINSIVAILGASIFSVLFFRERATAVWWAMLSCGVLSVVLLNLDFAGAGFV